MATSSDRRQEFIAWLRRNAIPLTTVGANRGFADLQPLKHVIGNARIVALGEATHGTREFFQLKHRLLEFLVTEMGFTTFAIEANWPESQTINDYVVHGRGDPAEALAGLHFWTWDTEEVLDLIVWMRQYNVRTAHGPKITFTGFDAQFSTLAASRVKAYLTQADPRFAAEVAPRLMLFEKEDRDYSTWSEADVASVQSTVQELADRLHAKARRYVAQTGAQTWRQACQHVRILCQVDEQRRAGNDAKTRYSVRDRAMAANVAWILDDEGPRSKMVIWAHNGHVTRDTGGIFGGSVESMGMHLAREFGPELVVIGFAFGEGAFQAIVKEGGSGAQLREIVVGPPPEEYLDAILARTGIPVFLLDLRHADVDLAPWLNESQVTREIGAFFESAEAMGESIVLRDRYDVLAFISRTTRARPNVHGRLLGAKRGRGGA